MTEMRSDLADLPDLPAVLENAMAQHRAGNLAQAETLYRQILDLQPRHPDALHLLGLTAHQQGRHEEAIALIDKAIAIAPTAAMHANLGHVFHARELAPALTEQTPASRWGSGIMANAGLPEFASASPNEYINLAIRFASDLSLLQRNRQSLRDTCPLFHQLGDHHFTPDLEQASRQARANWCATGTDRKRS